MLNFELSKVGEYWRIFASGFNFRRHAGPLDSFEKIEDFVITRSAFIAQKTLYGYVKTRMGTRYTEMFKNDQMIRSINIAKMQVFDACLSDLTVWAVAVAYARIAADDSALAAMAVRIFDHGLERNPDPSVTEFSPADARAVFYRRVQFADWHGIAATRDNFIESPARVVKWAPIADTLKRMDAEYVENSVTFAWADVRRAFAKRLDTAAIAREVAKATAPERTGTR
ncbi:MAG: hypothetical protein WD075_01210 [Rhodospirillales bacterium]